MNKRLETAIAKVRQLPEDRQAVAADILTTIAAQEAPSYRLTEAQLARVDRSLAEAERGEFARPDEVDALYKKYGG